LPTPPEQPKIYHILHKDRLANVLAAGGLHCDATMHQRQDAGTTIGMSRIKERRLALPVKCYPETTVGEYVPFYYCPRSIMLYILSQANHPDLAYQGGQGPILHLEADLYKTMEWADKNGIRWAFSLGNAGANYTAFRATKEQLSEINWDAVRATDFRDPTIKEGKQAEFLLKESFPWELVERIGVHSQAIGEEVLRTLAGATHRPVVDTRRDWYY
jgi:ssDNA thymidine ADP-ribosyltransferase, DarT